MQMDLLCSMLLERGRAVRRIIGSPPLLRARIARRGRWRAGENGAARLRVSAVPASTQPNASRNQSSAKSVSVMPLPPRFLARPVRMARRKVGESYELPADNLTNLHRQIP